MTDPQPPRALSVIKQQDLTLLTESGLLSVENQKALTTAALSIPAMRDASMPVGERHFARTDSVLAIRSNSPIDQARDVLSTLDKLWSGAGTEFHRLRQIHFEIKLRQTKVTVARKKLDKLTDPDEVAVAEAEIALAEAQMDALIASVSQDQEKLQGVITKAVAQSQRYTELCKIAGVESFTADDFMRDEVSYLIKTAFWHAGQTFRSVDGRDKWDRQKTEGREPPKTRGQEFQRTLKARENMSVRVSMETSMWFEALGLSKDEVAAELKDIEQQKFSFDRGYAGHPNPPSFFEYFEVWLKQLAIKYSGRVLETVKKHGPDRLKRLQSIITPVETDVGKGGGTQMDRGSLFEP